MSNLGIDPKTDLEGLGCVLQCKYTDRALGLILVSPLAQSTSWTEWLHNQVQHQTYFDGYLMNVQDRSLILLLYVLLVLT